MHSTSTQLSKMQFPPRHSSLPAADRTLSRALGTLAFGSARPTTRSEESPLPERGPVLEAQGAQRGQTGIQGEKRQEQFPGRDAWGKNIRPDSWPCAFSCYNFTRIGTDTGRGWRLALGPRCLLTPEPGVQRRPRTGRCSKRHRWGGIGTASGPPLITRLVF